MKWIAAGVGALGTAGVIAMLARRSSYSFKDKAVFITGGSRGLGLLMAREFAEEGARLTLIARDRMELEAAETELMDTGSSVLTLTCDVRDQGQVRSAIETSIRMYGAIDVLINNAGVIQVGPFEEMDIDDFKNALDIHLWGPFHTTMAAIPYMRNQGEGRIVNISSIGGKIAVPHLMPYSVSKFALAGLSDAMRAELRRYGIYVTSVYPGLMRTGSHVFADARGKSEEESAWFSFMATNPLFAINAGRAAQQIVEACRRGQPELVISVQANLAVLAQGIAPGLVARFSALVNRMLPGPTEALERRAA